MKALILAAGFGNRMSPLTNNKHKTLLPINGEPIMDRIVSSLIQNGIQKVIVVTGYRSAELIEHLQKNFKTVKFEFVHNAKYRETNNIFSLALAFEQISLDEDLLLIESDLIYTPDVIKKAIESKYENVALVSPYRIGLDGTVVQISGNKITSIFPPHLQDEKFNLFDKFKTLNIYKFSKEFCVNEFKKLLVYYAKTIDDNCYYELILGILIYMQRQDIHCEIIDNDSWVEVDDPNDMMGAEFVFNSEKRLNILEESFGGYWNYDILDFCFIRNMYFPTDSVLAEIKNNLPDILLNYGSKQNILDRKLSYVLQCDEKRLIALNGASQIFPIISNIFGNQRALIPNPTFGEYEKIFPNSLTYNDRVGINEKEVESLISECKIVVFVNPNNPTGSIVKTSKIIELINKFEDKYFIIDESFIEFSEEPSVIDYLENNPKDNVLVIRSMSKNYGMPGIRLGFVYLCNIELLQNFKSMIPIWNMNSIAEFYMEIILKNKRDLNKSFIRTKNDRFEFIQVLRNSNYFDEVYESEADFILVRKAKIKSSSELVKYLLSNHLIYIKDVSSKMVDNQNNYYRIAVRKPEENNRLIDAINKWKD